ncbi:sugar ABC transporter substrate-binding protein [Lichenibacterium ramalinae]|uniref:Sugar ABC transporter substrate-binding protein n=1 Tax=Lichenibacterium ramalinae TaxID=2316527 RepID=A0A4Q2RG07_9HYPH|nr:sugar ABC transporter substrate-binding protein [Lichenibacterium ramalinae]RYB05315.1 sugar ABC transporter substrate-binding protein [Lichenibacterium ramalinae]
MKTSTLAGAALASLPFIAGAAGLGHAQEPAKDKAKVFLSMSYIGNDWQAEATNMIKAMAASPDVASRIDLDVQVAGANAQKQIQQINAMVQAGAKAILVYPISPTALNQVVKNACSKGVMVIAYDAQITEPCAYNVSMDQEEAGRVTAEWLVKVLGGKGNIVAVTGVPGTSVDTLRTKAAKEVFAKSPGIKIVAEAPGMWSQAVARTELSKILATQSWDRIDGLWMQVGCFTADQMQLESGIAEDKLKPCAGEGSNGGRVQMLPKGTPVEGANGAYKPMAAPRISYASPPYSGAYALRLVVDKLSGKDVPLKTVLPLPIVTNDTVKLCKTGTWQEMSEGCNVFQPAVVSNPGWFASIFSAGTPEVGLKAALSAEPEKLR